MPGGIMSEVRHAEMLERLEAFFVLPNGIRRFTTHQGRSQREGQRYEPAPGYSWVEEVKTKSIQRIRFRRMS